MILLSLTQGVKKGDQVIQDGKESTRLRSTKLSMGAGLEAPNVGLRSKALKAPHLLGQGRSSQQASEKASRSPVATKLKAAKCKSRIYYSYHTLGAYSF